MVDWMIEVMATFKQEDRTFFLAVSLMDRFFKNMNTGLKVGDLHLIGITAMYLASKAVDTHPLSMTTVHEQIAHKLFEED
jgi:hypothetical protein